MAVRTPDDGVVWNLDASGLTAAEVVRSDGPAWQAGIRPGDRVVAIDGRRVEDVLSLRDRLWEIHRDRSASYTIQRGDERLEIPVRLSYRAVTPPLYSYLAVVGLFFLFSGLIVFLRLPADPAARIFFFLCLAQYLMLVLSPTGRAGGFDWLLYWGDQFGRLLAPVLVLHLALRFPRRSGVEPRFPVELYLPAAVLLGANILLIGFGWILRFVDPLAALRVKDRLELLIAAVYLIVAAVLLFRSWRRGSDRHCRDQLRWVGVGSALGLLPFSLMYLLPWGLGWPVRGWWELSAFPMVLLPLFLAAAISSYRILELDFFLKKGIRFLSFSFFTVAVFLGASITLTSLLRPYGGSPDRVGAVLAAILAAVLVPPMRRFSNALVDQLFYSSRYDLRRTLVEFTRELSAIYDLRDLVQAFTERIRRSLEVDGVAVLVRTDSEFRFRLVDPPDASIAGDECWDAAEGRLDFRRRDFLEAEDLMRIGFTGIVRSERGASYTLVVPMRVRVRVTALLAVRGRGPAGSVGREDRDLLVSLCGQAAGALESARLHGELEARIEEIDRLRQYSDGILESSRVGIMVVGPGGNIRAWNGTMARLSGFERRESIGRPAAEIFPQDLLHSIGLAGTDPPGGTERRLARYPLPLPQGGRILVNVTASQLAAEAGGRGGTVLTFDDVTNQVRMHEELAQKEKLAAVGLLAAGVAHEVNTPLTGIASYAQMLLHGGSRNLEERRMLKQIETQAFRASEIANRLLDLARSDGDLHEIVPVNTLVRETVALFSPQVRGKRIEIEADLEEIPDLVGNRGRLQQVLLNLLWNSVDAMPQGGRIGVSSRSSGSEVCIAVRDTGIGIPAEILPRLYDPFFSTKRSQGGTGLGLSVSYGIVEEHGGRFEVDSAPGRGSDFRLYLPSATARVRQAG
jgi:PAS domain S-box-containing protein